MTTLSQDYAVNETLGKTRLIIFLFAQKNILLKGRGMAVNEIIWAFQRIVGVDNVSFASVHLRQCETATFVTDQRIRASVAPASSSEIQAIFEVANRFGVYVYPISRGRNCGYGSKVPYKDGSVLLDL